MMGAPTKPVVVDRRPWPAGLLVLRTLVPADAPALQALWDRQPPAMRRLRFHGACNGISAATLQERCAHRRGHRSLVVECRGAAAPPQLVAEACYAPARQAGWADFALLVDLPLQRKGLGGWALRALLQGAAADGLQGLRGDVLDGNRGMRALALSLGALEWNDGPTDAACVVELTVASRPWSARLVRYLNELRWAARPLPDRASTPR